MRRYQVVAHQPWRCRRTLNNCTLTRNVIAGDYFSTGSGPKPRRGGLFIDSSPNHPFFLFFGGAGLMRAARSQLNQAAQSMACPSCNSAPPKNKKREVLGVSVSLHKPARVARRSCPYIFAPANQLGFYAGFVWRIIPCFLASFCNRFCSVWATRSWYFLSPAST